MQDLIERLQKAAAPDRELDRSIHIAVDGNTVVPTYTESIDAALKLVLEPGWQLGTADDGRTYYAFVGRNEYEHGATLAISLCLAALKARQATSSAP